MFAKFTSKLPSFNNSGVHFSVGKIIYWMGSFGQWAGWIYWVGKVRYTTWANAHPVNLLFTSLVYEKKISCNCSNGTRSIDCLHIGEQMPNRCTMQTDLTGGNWQKWKRVFLTCPCHKIYRDEAVGLKSCKYTWKITKLVKMGNLGQYRENLIFCQ